MTSEEKSKLKDKVNAFILDNASPKLKEAIVDLIDEKNWEYECGSCEYEFDPIEALEYIDDTRTYVIDENKKAWKNLQVKLGELLPEHIDWDVRISRLVPISDESRMSAMTIGSNGEMKRFRGFTKHNNKWYDSAVY